MSTRILSLSLLLNAVFCLGLAQADQQTASSAASADLSRRLNLPLEKIKAVSIQPQTFTDASLGLPRADETYAQALTPGYIIILSPGRGLYLYTATDRAVKYGGPLESWAMSALYLQPVENEPNLNGNLMQVSLAGTNPKVLLESVSAFWPQFNGSVLAKRRTSRSGHELFYIAPGQSSAKSLLKAFEVTSPAISKDGARWAALTRPAVGRGWQFTIGSLTEDDKSVEALPEGWPEKLWWDQEDPVILIKQGDKRAYYGLKQGAAGANWQKIERYYPEEDRQLVLNKSQTLVAQTVQVDGKPVTRVASHWFTGDEDPIVTIPNFDVTKTTMLPGSRFALLVGERAGTSLALTVDIVTGEVLQTVEREGASAQLLAAPPQAMVIMEAIQKLRQGPAED